MEGDFRGTSAGGVCSALSFDEELMICANCKGKLMCLCKVVCFAGVDTMPEVAAINLSHGD